MKTRTIQAVIYGIFIIGASIAFTPIVFPFLSVFSAAFTYLGGAIVVFGIIFCVMLLRSPGCPYCRELLSIWSQSPASCPHCGEKLQ